MGKMTKPEPALVLAGGVVLVGVGLWLASNPICDRGCKTVAEHLIEHGISDFIAGLFV
jgi:hypothetical protein